MKFNTFLLVFLTFLPQIVWSACDLSATTASEVNTSRQLTNADTSALTAAAKRGDDITDCDVSGITDMESLFYYTPNIFFGETEFNQNIGGWDVSNVTNMSSMFRGSDFNQNIGGWDVSNVADMSNMFRGSDFNQNIGGWDVSSVTDMERMFVFSTSFNQDITGWNVSNVTSFFAMFEGASAFNQDIRVWDVSSATTFQGMFMNATAMNTNFSAPDWPTAAFFTDTTAPTMTITSAEVSDGAISNDASLSLTFTSSEATTDFQEIDISVTGGLLSNFTATSSATYTATFTPTATGATTIDVASSTFTDAAGNSNTAATQFNWTYDNASPTVTLTGPIDVVTADFTVTATFSKAVSGFALDDITTTNGTASALVTSNAPVYTFTITPTLGTSVSVSIAANKVTDDLGNANAASNNLSIQAGSPASEFTANEAAIRSIITSDARRSLNSALASNTRHTRKARERYLNNRTQMQDGNTSVYGSRDAETSYFDGSVDASVDKMVTQVMFFQQTGNFEGTQRRLVFGDFDLQRDGDTGSTTATINGKIAWERMLSEQMMLGYYLGGEVSRSKIKGSFTGSQDKYGISVGGYFVHALQKHLLLEGFASLGALRNELNMGNDTLDLTSDYTNRTTTLGVAVSGIIEQSGYDISPELSVTPTEQLSLGISGSQVLPTV